MSWQDRLLARTAQDLIENVFPEPDAYGVPRCTERCPSHDGKRCEVLGHRPESICEPGVVMLVADLKRRYLERA